MTNLLLIPLVNRSISANEKVAEANQFASRILAILVVVSLPFLLFPRLAVALLFAHAFLAAAGFLFAFVIWQCLAQLVNVYTQLLIGLDDVAFACGTLCANFGVALLLTAPMMAVLGLPGVAVALIVGTVLGGLTNVVRLNRKFHASAGRKVLLRLVFSVAAMSVAAVVAAQSAQGSPSGLLFRLIVVVLVLGVQWKLLDSTEIYWLRTRFRQSREK